MKMIKFFAVAVAAAFAISCANQENIKVDAEVPTSAEIDSVSYLLGINYGAFIKGNNFATDLDELNMAEIKKGIQDFLKAEGSPYEPEFGQQFKINPDQMGEILNGFIAKKQNYKAALNLAKEKEFLAKNAVKEGIDTTASGLQYKIEVAGGDYKVAPEDTVWVNYKGTLIDGTVFDENDSTQFVANRVIKGWTEGLGLLGEGGKATLYIPAELAYGERGNRNIEPNSTLIFDVEVIRIGKFAAEEEK